ncbi:MAG TPA: DinB family protein [Longimicrobium sp.]|jgi:uncharacterized damage-inducible protein DinB
MIEEMRRLYAHLRWADRRVLEALRGAPGPPDDALRIYAHVLGAEHTWLSRLRERPATVAIWPTLTLDECAALARENADGFDALLEEAGMGGLAREVAYRNSAGDEFRSRIDDILLHAAMHGAYHRGQVALLLRRAGAEPLATDYIAFVRGAPAATRRD